MADVRSFDDAGASVADLQAQLDDFKSTMAVRMVTRPTGTIEPIIRTTPPAGALLCNGQSVLRADWPALLQFAIDQVILGGTNPVFGVGDGSTTFTMPNMTGRLLVGAGTLSGDTYVLGTTVGTAKPTMTTAQLPAHTHTFTTDSQGNHGNHAGYSWQGDHADLNGNGSNTIDGGLVNAGTHGHAGTSNSTGSTSAIDVRQPSYVTNYMVWG